MKKKTIKLYMYVDSDRDPITLGMIPKGESKHSIFMNSVNRLVDFNIPVMCEPAIPVVLKTLSGENWTKDGLSWDDVDLINTSCYSLKAPDYFPVSLLEGYKESSILYVELQSGNILEIILKQNKSPHNELPFEGMMKLVMISYPYVKQDDEELGRVRVLR